jgi:chromosome segregation ATPase
MIRRARFTGSHALLPALSLLLTLFSAPISGIAGDPQNAGDAEGAALRRLELQRHEERFDAEMREVSERIQGMKCEEARLREAGRNDEAERIRKQVGRLVEQVQGRREEMKRNLARHEAQKMERRLSELADKQGPDAEAERRKIEGAMKELQLRLRLPEAGSRQRHADGKRTEAEQRLRHMRAAAENLKAAGMEDAARRVMEEAEKIQRRLRSESAPPEALQRQVEELTRAVRELRAEIGNVHRELQGLKQDGH